MTETKREAVAVLATSATVVEREERRSLEEMTFDTVLAALDKAGITPNDLGAVVVSGNDEIDGRVISIMPSSGPTGGVGRDITMIASSADHALSYGYLRVLAGQGDRVLVVGWAKPSESVSPERAEHMGAEPYILRDLGMNETIAAALQASRWAEHTEVTTDEPFVAWPLTRSDLPARADAVYALVLARESCVEPGTEEAWMVATGWATSSYELGERELGELDSLGHAIEQIVAKVPNAAPERWTAAEIGAGSEWAVRQATLQLGLDPECVNVSGRLSEVGTSPFAMGLGRMVSAVRSVKRQTDEDALVAGIGFHGFASQGATVAVFSSKKEV